MTQREFSAADKRALALAERRRLRGTLASLSPEQWAAPSLCEGWTVREIAGHIAENTRSSMLSFMGGMAGARFDHDEYNRRTARKWSRRSNEEIVAALDTDRIMSVFRLAPALLLVDYVVHHQDIRRPLGLGTDFPEDHLAAVLQVILTDGMFASEAERAKGRRVVATDIDFRYGEGPEELRGPAEHLITTIMGRRSDSAEQNPS